MPNDYEYSSRGIVASNIKRLMRQKGVIASDVCRALKIPNATFSDWINGKTYPRIKQLEKLAVYFNVSTAEIVDIPIDRDDPVYRAAKEKTYQQVMEGPDGPRKVRARLLMAFDNLPPELQEILAVQAEAALAAQKARDTHQEP